MLYLLCMDDPAAKLQTAIHLLNDLTDQPVSDWMTADRVSVDPDIESADATETMLAGASAISQSSGVGLSVAS